MADESPEAKRNRHMPRIAVVVKEISGRFYIYFKHGREWCYVGPLDEVFSNLTQYVDPDVLEELRRLLEKQVQTIVTPEAKPRICICSNSGKIVLLSISLIVLAVALLVTHFLSMGTGAIMPEVTHGLVPYRAVNVGIVATRPLVYKVHIDGASATIRVEQGETTAVAIGVLDLNNKTFRIVRVVEVLHGSNNITTIKMLVKQLLDETSRYESTVDNKSNTRRDSYSLLHTQL